MSDEPERREIVDEYGVLVQRRSARGNWMDHQRILTDGNGQEHVVNLESRGPHRARTKDYIAGIRGGNIRLRKNMMNDRIEYNDEPITDMLEARTLNWLRDIGLKGENKMRDAMLEEAHRNRYHPIRDYLKSLEWDGYDHIGAFLAYLEPAEKVRDIMPTFWRKWLVGAVAKIMEGGQNFMLVLDGPQGCGKSYLARWMCPLELQDRYFIEGAVRPDDKDSDIRLMSKWIWEVGELQATTRRSDMEALKDFITRKDVTVRVPFGRYDIVKPAAASFIGTINENGAGFLADMTGTRRFAICEVERIDWDYAKLGIGQIWAQAVALYLDGFDWLLDSGERSRQEEVNRAYEMPSTVGELLFRYYELQPDAPADPDEFVPSSEILGELRLRGLIGNNSKSQYMELASLMRREGVTKGKVDNVNGYYGVKQKAQHKTLSSKNGDIRL